MGPVSDCSIDFRSLGVIGTTGRYFVDVLEDFEIDIAVGLLL